VTAVRLAVLSDVHGNLAALRAVVRALADEGPLDRVVVAGDHVQGGPRPQEVWQTLNGLGWTLVRGNEDEAVAGVLGTAPAAHTGTGDYLLSYHAQLAWTRAVLGPATVRDLAALPLSWRTRTPAGELLVVHSSPRDTNDRCGAPENLAADVTAAYGGTGAAVIAFGHYHRSFVRPMPFALLVNVASVSLALDRRPLAAYTILTATEDGWRVAQHRVPYDAAEEGAATRARGLPAWLR
jgi:predicted phosphodiesterase